jgi:hypothetical protein
MAMLWQGTYLERQTRDIRNVGSDVESGADYDGVALPLFIFCASDYPVAKKAICRNNFLVDKRIKAHDVAAIVGLADIRDPGIGLDKLPQAEAGNIRLQICYICLGCCEVRRLKGKAVVREGCEVFGRDKLQREQSISTAA